MPALDPVQQRILTRFLPLSILPADPAMITAGTTAGLALPSTVSDGAGLTYVAGNTWDIPSPDKTLN